VSAPVAFVGSYEHPPRGLRRSPFAVRVLVSSSHDPETYWRIVDCPACGRSHERVAVAFRKPRHSERIAGAADLHKIAEPLPDPSAGWPHPVTRKVSLD
jgi:hypothetical protein